jgi:hypothetical protein
MLIKISQRNIEKKEYFATVIRSVKTNLVWKTVWRFLKKKLKMESLYDPPVPVLSLYSHRN